MKTIEEQDHYEVLELPRGARKEDVERAYPLVRGAYEKRSLALYSIYDDTASDAIRERIELAYRVLSNDESRRLYDESLGLDPPKPQEPVATGMRAAAEAVGRRLSLPPLLQGAVQRPVFTRGSASEPSEPPVERRDLAPPPVDREAHEARTLEALEEMEDESSDDFGGARLRRMRLGAGLELDQVSKVTKIAERHLEAIEDERFEELPADVYVRGFVASYARTLGLDAATVASSYMQRCSAARSTEPVRRLFSR